MAKIGPIFFIIFPEIRTVVQPAVFLQLPLYFCPVERVYTYSLFGFGSSNKTNKTNFGFEDGKIDIKVFTLSLV